MAGADPHPPADNPESGLSISGMLTFAIPLRYGARAQRLPARRGPRLGTGRRADPTGTAARAARHRNGPSSCRPLRLGAAARVHLRSVPAGVPMGGAEMRIIAFITDGPTVQDILVHLGEPTPHPGSHPPVARHFGNCRP